MVLAPFQVGGSVFIWKGLSVELRILKVKPVTGLMMIEDAMAETMYDTEVENKHQIFDFKMWFFFYEFFQIYLKLSFLLCRTLFFYLPLYLTRFICLILFLPFSFTVQPFVYCLHWSNYPILFIYNGQEIRVISQVDDLLFSVLSYNSNETADNSSKMNNKRYFTKKNSLDELRPSVTYLTCPISVT